MRTIPSDIHGFTLIEILAGTAIFAIVMALLLSLLNSFEATSDIKITQKRMEKIVASAGKYYLSRENLPAPTVPGPPIQPAPAGTVGDVPLTALHLDAKDRIDAWGRPFQYFTVRNDGQNGRPGQILIDPLSAGAPAGAPPAMVDIPLSDLTAIPPVDGKTLLRGVQLNGRLVAGILISSGPDNIFGYTQTAGYPEIFTLDAGSDDIVFPIDLTPQATQIVQTELKKLGEKVRAFDDRFIGKNNNWNTTYDENGCTNVIYPGPGITIQIIGDRAADLSNPNDPAALSPVCNTFPQYPGADYLPSDGFDYSCGLPTLDDMKANYCDINLGLGNCPQGYYVPNQLQRGYNYTPIPVPSPPNFDVWVETLIDCPPPGPYVGADYFRVPMDRGNPQPDNCHWGLVGDPNYIFPTGALNSELNNEQTRAFIFCAYGLSPTDIVDPWLSGYIWGCGVGSGQTGAPCTNEYPDTDPHFHKFFSAGPDQTVNSTDDIVAPL